MKIQPVVLLLIAKPIGGANCNGSMSTYTLSPCVNTDSSSKGNKCNSYSKLGIFLYILRSVFTQSRHAVLSCKTKFGPSLYDEKTGRD